jgi:orotidine-5'-phosphate decarboxylase
MYMSFTNRFGYTAAKDLIFPSVDVDTLDEAKQLMDSFAGLLTHVKVGLQLATREGWASVVAAAHERGLKAFCDAKFKDIPNTVEHAAYSLTAHKPDFFTVMTDNSAEALRGARAGVDRAAADMGINEKPKLIGVTVLTSISPEESQVIYGADPATKALFFGSNAVDAGFDAIVCSPEEIHLFREDAAFEGTAIITPGVRPTWAASNDQSRVATPAEAIQRGADMLVIGRPITQPPAEVGSTQEAIKRIIQEIEEALA